MIRLFLFLFFVANSASASFFVGNAGTGIKVDGRVYLRDLYDSQIHQSAVVGSRIDPQLPLLPKLSFTYPENVLARKLTDLNSNSPGFGDYLVMAMKQYQWILVDSDLTPIEPISPIKTGPNEEVVQLAGRLGKTIRISKTFWNQMDDENKVALLLHEAVFSLLVPQKQSDGFYNQSSLAAQEATASFFMNAAPTNANQLDYCQASIYDFDIPPCMNLSEIRTPLSIQIEKSWGNKSVIKSAQFAANQSSAFQAFWNTACAEAADGIAPSQSFQLAILYSLQKFTVSQNIFSPAPGSSQVALKIGTSGSLRKHHLNYPKDERRIEKCQNEVPLDIEMFFLAL